MHNFRQISNPTLNKFKQFTQAPKLYWQSIDKSRELLDKIAIELNLKNPRDWGKVSTKVFREHGGDGILNYYKSSLYDCLASVYRGKFYNILAQISKKEVKWKRDWFTQVPRMHWQSMENRRKLLDEIAIKLNIKTISDWGKVSLQQFREHGGTGILNYYNWSLFDCLKSVYNGIFELNFELQRYQMG